MAKKKQNKRPSFNPPAITLPETVPVYTYSTENTAFKNKINMVPICIHDDNPSKLAILFAMQPQDIDHILKTDSESNEQETEIQQQMAQSDSQDKNEFRLLRAYCNALQISKFAEPQDTILNNYDFIDVYSAIEKIGQDEMLRAKYLKFISNPKNMFYTMIPCFNTGVIRTRFGLYIQWEIKNIDLNQKSYTVKIKVYTNELAYDKQTWWCKHESINHVTVESDINQSKTFVQTPVDSILQADQILYGVNPRSMNLNPKELADWLKYRKIYMNFCQQLTKNGRSFQCCELMKSFLLSQSVANFFMHQAKSEMPIKALTSRSDGVSAKPVSVPSEPIKAAQKAPERVLRIIDVVAFKSETMPILPTRKSIAQYRLAQWQTRGHMRHYKSGKTVYIKPSIHHRKKLLDTDSGDQNIPKQTIYIRDNTPPDETQNETENVNHD